LPSCARRGQQPLPARLAAARQGSAVVLAREGSRLLAYVADADSHSVHTVSIDDRRELGHTRLGGSPRQLLVLADGRVVATLSDGARLAVLEPDPDPTRPLATLCERDVPAEPWGLALSPDDGRLVVTSAWAGTLSILDAATFATRRVVPLARDPRGVLVDEGGVAYVSHLVGARMSMVDLASADAAPEVVDLAARKSSPRAQLADMVARRTGSQGYALASVSMPARVGGEASLRRVLLPMVSVDPGDPGRPSSVYYGPPFDGVPKEAPMVSVVDPERKEMVTPYLLAATETTFARECLLPRAAAVRDRTRSLLVTCFGIDALLELDAWALDPFRAERKRFDVPPGPEGVAVDETSGRAVVFSQLGGALTVIDLDHAATRKATIDLDYRPDPKLAAVARGRQLFYRTDDVRISGDGLGCSSCHQDGRDDAITWATPLGARQTLMLAGRVADTQPYGWEGDRATLADYIGNTVTRLGGKGLAQPELESLSAFLLALEGPPAPPARASDAALARRGRALFEDPAQGCVTCHAGSASTDAAVHNLTQGSLGFQSTTFDTPSLRFVRGTAPYFHDGRYPTLEELLADDKSTMGHSASLPEGERAALAAYLRSL
jgi:hypothetical protein